MTNNTKLVLSEEFDRLKGRFQQPKLYLNNYFSTIRDEIDIAFAQKRINESDESLKGILFTTLSFCIIKEKNNN